MYPSGSKKKESGFLLPVAIFLVIGIAALALGVSKLSSQSSGSVFREGITMQTFYAAESATQWAMNQILFPEPTRTTATANCNNLNTAGSPALTFTSAGLVGCAADVSCVSSNDSSDTITFFTVSSSASCGIGGLLSERTIRASAYISD